MRNSLTWLHLSDVHFHPKTKWRDHAVRSQLLRYLKDIFSDDVSLHPDFIFCTGDIAFGESSETPIADQYIQAKDFFEQLLTVCGLNGVPFEKDRLFVVPGNHDVNREAVNTDAQSNLTLWAKDAINHVDTINQRFDDRSVEFRDAIKRLEEYAKFVEDYLPHQHDPNGRHHYCRKIDVNGLAVGIAGFNSAWTCAGPEDDRNIWLAANWQFNQAQENLNGAAIKIGLMHHPVDWLNIADRDAATRGVAANFDFWLHGHSHNAWVTPIQSHVTVAAGAVGATCTEEFGINIVCFNPIDRSGVVYLHSRKSGTSGWTIAPVAVHAPKAEWSFKLQRKNPTLAAPPLQQKVPSANGGGMSTTGASTEDVTERVLIQRLDNALMAFNYQPKVWISPTLSKKPETAKDSAAAPKIDLSDFIRNPRSTIIKAPPQYGLTCLSRDLARVAWQIDKSSLWLYVDANNLKPHLGSLQQAVQDELANLGCSEQNIRCVILDSWSLQGKDALKILTNVCNLFKDLPVVCMQHADTDAFGQTDRITLPRTFDTLYLWALPRGQIREIVAAYNNARHIGDEDLVTSRIVSDLLVLNLHRTPLNCLTLLKVSELDFDESPVNRSEMIRRVLFLLFNVEKIPTYTTRPDLKDCEYVLGFFCETLIRGGDYSFSREQFLRAINKCCAERLIDLETHFVFDVLAVNNILVKRGSLFCFKFSYWIFYFAAQRMLDDPDFASFISTICDIPIILKSSSSIRE